MNRRVTYLLLLLAAVTSVLCASPPSFCKCTCFSNSTIIPLDTPPSSDVSSSLSDSTFHPLFLLRKTPTSSSKKKQAQKTCADCNRQFCLDYNLPICKDVVKEETDVFATCFQRDSFKDEVVVFVFIAATVGLLAWSLVGGFLAGMVEKVRGRHVYNPVSG